MWLIALCFYKVFPIPVEWLAVAALAGVSAIVIGAIAGGWHKPSPSEIARWVDLKQNLKERLSTALEVAQSSAGEEWKTLLVADASQHAQGLDAKRLLPFTFRK